MAPELPATSSARLPFAHWRPFDHAMYCRNQMSARQDDALSKCRNPLDHFSSLQRWFSSSTKPLKLTPYFLSIVARPIE